MILSIAGFSNEYSDLGISQEFRRSPKMEVSDATVFLIL